MIDLELLRSIKELKRKNPIEYLRVMNSYKQQQPELYNEIIKSLSSKEVVEAPAITDIRPKGYPFQIDLSKTTNAETKKVKKPIKINWFFFFAIFGLVVMLIAFVLMFFIL